MLPFAKIPNPETATEFEPIRSGIAGVVILDANDEMMMRLEETAYPALSPAKSYGSNANINKSFHELILSKTESDVDTCLSFLI